MIISCLSQKGGVGKSSIARTLAVEFTRAGWAVLLADIDASQKTADEWSEKRRNVAGIDPAVLTESFKITAKALAQASEYDLVVIDGAPHATKGTLDAALASDLTILPTGTSVDDMKTQIKIAIELVDSGVSYDKLWFALYCVASKSQERQALETIRECGFNVFEHTVPFSAGYINAFDAGYCATETSYTTLNKKAGGLITDIINRVTG